MNPSETPDIDQAFPDQWGRFHRIDDGYSMGSITWSWTRGYFVFYHYSGDYGRRWKYRGPEIPRSNAAWREESYTVEIGLEIRVVHFAARGFNCYTLQRLIDAPMGEISSIMEFHGYDPHQHTTDPAERAAESRWSGYWSKRGERARQVLRRAAGF